MPSATVKWVQNKTFVGTDSSKHSVVLSTQDGDNGVGMKPAELLLVALAACTAVDVVEILAKKRTPLESLEIAAYGDQDSEPPWAYRSIHLDYRLRGAGLTRRAVDQAIHLAEEKYCCVSATVRGVAAITYEFHIDGEDEPEAAPARAELTKETIP
jgi:putative redox protein